MPLWATTITRILAFFLLCSTAHAQALFRSQNSAKYGSPPLPGQRLATAFGDGTHTSINQVMAANPIQGHLVSGFVFVFNSNTITMTLADANSNNYVVTSPVRDNAAPGTMWGFYLLNAPANASATLTMTFSVAPGTSFGSFYVEETPVNGTAVFDTSASAVVQGPGTAINTPSITPTAAGEFLHAVTFPNTAVTATGAPWTAGGTRGTNNDQDAYISSSAAGATAVNFTQTSNQAWDAMIMAFK